MCRIGAIIGDLPKAASYLHAFRQFGVANADGSGIGAFVKGAASIAKSTASAVDNPAFDGISQLADDAPSMIMHVRKATSGATSLRNSHPFHVGDHVFAHNGTFGELDKLDDVMGREGLRRIGVAGDTDSERFGALLHKLTEEAGGDITEGYRRTTAYLADNHPMTSLSSVSVRPNGDVYALRYPENRSLFWKRQGARDAAEGHRLLAGSVDAAKATASDTADAPLTVIASRPLDASAGWQELMPGELLHVRAGDLGETITKVIDREPLRRFADTHVDEGARWLGARRSTMIEADFGA